MKFVEIGSRRVGLGYPTYIVAELSANHNNDFDQAVRIVEAAKQAGADAVKLQAYTPDTMTIDCDSEHFRIQGTLWDGRTLYELYREASTPWSWHSKLQEIAKGLGLDLFSAPFDLTAVDFLQGINMPAYKVASFENVDHQLLRKIALTGKPIIMSTGLASLAEIEESVSTIRNTGHDQLILLKCTSAYPAPPEEMNLRTIPHLAAAFDLPVGLSDHTLGVAVPIAGVAFGACMIEKHLTLSRTVEGPDSVFSLEPHEFKTMVDAVRVAEAAVGEINYELTESEESIRGFRRSLFVVEDVEAGEVFTAQNVRSIRPGYGLHTRFISSVMGRTARRDVSRGTPLGWDLVS